MGGSLALALKGKCAELLGLGPRRASLDIALREGFVSRADTDPAAILPQADVIVLASPIPAILELLSRLGELVPQECIVIDLGSSKGDVTRAMSALPERFDPIGGHPICGKEVLSIANADIALYHGAPFVLTPLERTTPRARRCAGQLVAALGARAIWMDAAAHDASIAATSHLPYLLASALVLATPKEAAVLVGPGFRSTSRLAATPQSMMLGVLETNRENVQAALARFRRQLEAVEAALADEDPAGLSALLEQAAALHGELVQ
jgi:prephenate dehydrogenase